MLKAYHFLFITEVVSTLELDDHTGTALRANFFNALWNRFCMNKAARMCAACPLNTACPVSSIVAPLREENPRGRDIPRPYLIEPPLGANRRYEVGQTLIFGLTLFGSIIQLLPYLLMVLEQLEIAGLGRRLPENGGQRGRFSIKSVESYHRFTEECYTIYERAKLSVEAKTFPVTLDDVAIRTANLPTEQITLDFLTPTRIIDKQALVQRLTFRSLVLRLTERLSSLQATYGENDEMGNHTSEAKPDLIRLSKDIICQKDETRWKDIQSYSHRLRRCTPVSGFTGQMTFTGDLAPFLELITWGEVIHVGRSAVKGNGWYKIVS